MQKKKSGFNRYNKFSNEAIANKAAKTEKDGECTSRKMTPEEREEFGLN